MPEQKTLDSVLKDTSNNMDQESKLACFDAHFDDAKNELINYCKLQCKNYEIFCKNIEKNGLKSILVELEKLC